MDIKIVGLSGSPRKGGNSEWLLGKALEGAVELGSTDLLPGDVETEMLSLATLRVECCKGCVSCHNVDDDEEKYCLSIEDDLSVIIDKMLSADGVIFSVPVYAGDVPAQMKAFMDRCEVISSASRRNKLIQGFRNKVGGSIVQGTFRHGGQEGTWATIHRFFILKNMISVGAMESHSPAGPFGGMGVGYPHGWEALSRKAISPKTASENDLLAIKSCRDLGKRVALVAKMIKPYASGERREWINLQRESSWG
jgi:multimeric flavodoxin WrbA